MWPRRVLLSTRDCDEHTEDYPWMRPRLVDPDDVPHVFDYEKTFYSFTPEEHLRFAIAFRRNPKAFEFIAQDVPDRTQRECLQHYYSVKHDGRLKTNTWAETNVKHDKANRALPELDFRMQGLTAVDRKIPPSNTQAMRNRLARRMQMIPINEEIKRLL